jgi:hypothetical protein
MEKNRNEKELELTILTDKVNKLKKEINDDEFRDYQYLIGECFHTSHTSYERVSKISYICHHEIGLEGCVITQPCENVGALSISTNAIFNVDKDRIVSSRILEEEFEKKFDEVVKALKLEKKKIFHKTK